MTDANLSINDSSILVEQHHVHNHQSTEAPLKKRCPSCDSETTSIGQFKCVEPACEERTCGHCIDILGDEFSNAPQICYGHMCRKSIEAIELDKSDWIEFYNLLDGEKLSEEEWGYLDLFDARKALPIILSIDPFDYALFPFETPGKPNWIKYYDFKGKVIQEAEERQFEKDKKQLAWKRAREQINLDVAKQKAQRRANKESKPIFVMRKKDKKMDINHFEKFYDTHDITVDDQGKNIPTEKIDFYVQEGDHVQPQSRLKRFKLWLSRIKS